MSRNPLLAAATLAHAVMSAAALYSVAIAALPSSARFLGAALACVILLPGLRVLIAGQANRFAWVALLLVLIIGAGLVEVMATGAAVHACILLGAAMLEFALLLSLSRRPPH